VLTAEQQNISAATGVPVFASTVTRDAAFGGANKVLAEGQTCYLEDANVVQYYDGAAWATVGPTAAPTSGLVVVKAETAFTTVASITADNVFTSTYTSYLINIRMLAASGVDVNFKLRVGGVSASSNYNAQRLTASGASVAAYRPGVNTFALFFSCAATNVGNVSLVLSGPQLAALTSYTATSNTGVADATLPSLGSYSGNHSTATAYDGIEILAADTMTGTYTIYGYGKTL